MISVSIPFLDEDIARSFSRRDYISQLLRIARVSCRAADRNSRNDTLSARLPIITQQIFLKTIYTPLRLGIKI